MSGFPMAWDDRISDQEMPSSMCPYSAQEIEEYLRNCQYDLAVHEPPMNFRVNGPILSRQLVGRNYWLFGAADELERQWFVLVGSGKSPFRTRNNTWRWMYAETNELDETPEAYFKDAYAQQLLHDLKD